DAASAGSAAGLCPIVRAGALPLARRQPRGSVTEWLDGFRPVQQGVEHRLRHAHALILFIECAQFLMRLIRLDRERRQTVEERKLPGIELLAWVGHDAPAIP